MPALGCRILLLLQYVHVLHAFLQALWDAKWRAMSEGNCPNSLVFAYDEGISPLICSASLKADYKVTFCP